PMSERFSPVVPMLASALFGAAVLAIAAAYGFTAFARAWQHPSAVWLACSFAAQALVPLAYVLSYRALAHGEERLELPLPLTAMMVLRGFGPSALHGGFVEDKRSLECLGLDADTARVRVVGLGALEWALLAPAAWACAVVLLADGARRASASVLWPWAVAVPVGLAIALTIATPARIARLYRGTAPLRALAALLDGVRMLRTLALELSSSWSAWLGMALYWALDMVSLYGAMRFIGLHPDLAQTVLGYATGYALTRRSMPVGGAGVTEALMSFSLHWMGQPILASLAAVVVYRVFNLLLPSVLTRTLTAIASLAGRELPGEQALPARGARARRPAR
ncbi:MAG TPA: hypothetical protein VKV16_03375, partial [Solirubrobacteraceae bacterium]|nr:hypothetical protein [Solirubrobacteraceae bacterium]